MSNKYSKPRNIKPPAVCTKTPPMPPPSRVPHGPLLLVYDYVLWDWVDVQLKGAGVLTMYWGPPGHWASNPDDAGPGQAFGAYDANLLTEVGNGRLEIFFEPGLGVEFTGEDKPWPDQPPFMYIALLLPDQPSVWQYGRANVQIFPL